MQATVHRFDGVVGSGSVLTDDGRELAFPAEVFAQSGLLHVRPGQRLSIEADENAVTRLWIVGIGHSQPIH